MEELLHRYFITYKTLVIPGIGDFRLQRHKSTFDFSKRIFTAPRFEVAFKQAPGAGDKHLYDYISKVQRIQYEEAIEQYNRYTNSIKNELEENKSVQLHGIGILVGSTRGQIVFESTTPKLTFFPGIIAERVARSTKQAGDTTKPFVATAENKELLVVEQPKEERRTRGIPEEERWWIFALILALIAMGAIFYYYYTNGSLT